MTHIPSEYIISKIKEFEGCYLKAYKCPAGKITIGYGITNDDINITGTKITLDSQISKETAELWLKKSLIKKYSPLVDKYDKIYNWNQNQFDALLSFAFNIGSIDQLTNNGKRTINEISKKIPEYNKSKGKVLEGLVRRRNFEKNLFDTPIDNNKKTLNDNNPLKSNEEIANEVINGKWGIGEERKRKIEQAGYNYQEIQNIVNLKLGSGSKTNNETSKEEIARKVIQGYYGKGEERKKKLESEGYNYNEIQSIVNSLLKK